MTLDPQADRRLGFDQREADRDAEERADRLAEMGPGYCDRMADWNLANHPRLKTLAELEAEVDDFCGDRLPLAKRDAAEQGPTQPNPGDAVVSPVVGAARAGTASAGVTAALPASPLADEEAM